MERIQRADGLVGKGLARPRDDIFGEALNLPMSRDFSKAAHKSLAPASFVLPSAMARQIARSHSIRVNSDDTTPSERFKAAKISGSAFSWNNHAKTALDSA